jgi:hypothetical protein
MREIIKRNLNGKKVLLLFIITNIVYAIMLTITIPEVMNFSDGMKILDMIPAGYDPEYVNSLLVRLGAEGRNAYLYHQIPVDMIYPFLFAISSCLILAYFLNKLKKSDGALFYLCFIPLFSGVFDYCENIGIIAMLNNFPESSNILIRTTSVFSVMKSLSTISYFIILAILLIVFGVKKLFMKVDLN